MALARTDAFEGSVSGADSVHWRPEDRQRATRSRRPPGPAKTRAAVLEPDVSSRSTAVAAPRSGPPSFVPTACHDLPSEVNTPTMPPWRHPVATSGIPVAMIATASTEVTPQLRETRPR